MDRHPAGLRIRGYFHPVGIDIDYTRLVTARQQRGYLVLEFWAVETGIGHRGLIAANPSAVDALVLAIERERRKQTSRTGEPVPRRKEPILIAFLLVGGVVLLAGMVGL